MLSNTFQHIHGIGPKTESDLWSKGVLDWNSLEKTDHTSILPGKFYFIRDQIEESKSALKDRDFTYFTKRLPSKEHWRVYMEALKTENSSIAYIDIETSFTTDGEQYISTVSLYDEKEIHCFIRGRNLYCFPDFIKKYSIIITFSGKTFDIPFMEYFFGIKFTNAHIDLRYVLSGMGYKGGLKKCEKLMGFQRKESEGIEGSMAPFLWNAYEKGGSIIHLNTLLAYNIEDVLGLYYLMHRIIEIKIAETPFRDVYGIDQKPFPEMPYTADKKLTARLKSMIKRQ